MKVIVVGCTHAGISATQALLEEYPDAEVKVYERSDNISFLSCGISLYLDGTVDYLEDMFYSSPEALGKLGANIRTEHDVFKIDPDNKTVSVQNIKTTEVFTERYDKLIYTAGSVPKLPPIIGSDSSRVFLCKDSLQAKQIKKSATDAKSIAIIGGGFVGVEMAESYARTGHQVQLFQSGNSLLSYSIDDELALRVKNELENLGVEIHLNSKIASFESKLGEKHINFYVENETFTVDIVVICTGYRPNTQILKGLVDLSSHGAIIVDKWMRTSDPDILAAGDACTTYFNPVDAIDYLPLATSAVRQGRLAGLNAFRNVEPTMGTQSTTALRINDYTLATTGITEKVAHKFNLENISSYTYKGNIRPTFMPNPTEVSVKLVFNKETHVVLGAQIFSASDVSQSANLISLLIQSKGTLETLAYVDMLFNPNYNQIYNYLNQAAQEALANI